MEADLAYKKATKTRLYEVESNNQPFQVSFSNNQSSFSAHPANVNTFSQAAPINMAVKCWNCQTTGHTFHACPQPRRRFCYKCGRPDVVVRRCPRCNPVTNGPNTVQPNRNSKNAVAEVEIQSVNPSLTQEPTNLNGNHG